MVLNREALKKHIEVVYKDNFSSFARELNVDVSHLWRAINKNIGSGKKVLGGIINYCKRKGLDYNSFIVSEVGTETAACSEIEGENENAANMLNQIQETIERLQAENKIAYDFIGEIVKKVEETPLDMGGTHSLIIDKTTLDKAKYILYKLK